LNEREEAGLSFGVVGASVHEHADTPQTFSLLGARRNRPCRRAAEQRDELAPYQPIKLHPLPASLGRLAG